ncbi:hypothetical protein V7128_18960 [Neobacillus vireti]|uniref:hypothetical protein n=1 Tax=Neobacillus vireti TaxID=220686 RepID=UPI002FFD8373
MKRYLKLILIILAIFLCLGTFYLKSSATSNPQFVFKKLSGSEKEANSIVIQGYYQNDRLMDNVMISSKDTVYDSSMSLLGKIDKHLLGFGNNQQLEEEYPSFMRGKTGVNSFYQDKDALIYANVIFKHSSVGLQDFRFEVSSLEKDTKAEHSYQIQPLNDKRYLYVSVEDIQRQGNHLKILTRNAAADHTAEAIDAERQEVHVYTINLDSKKVVDDQTVLTASDRENANFYMLQETDMTQPNDSAFYYKVISKPSEGGKEQVDSEFIWVNLKTNQVEKVTIPKELQENISLNVTPLYDNKMIYFAKETKKGIKVVSFDPKIEREVNSLNLKDDKGKWAKKFNFTVKNGKVYILTSPEKVGKDPQPATVNVLDLRTGNQLYKGVITPENVNNQFSKTDGFISLEKLIVE